jgi:thioredoxin
MDVTTETFEREVIERSHELPVVVDFWAAWCGPCRMLGPAIEAEVGKRADRLQLAKLDVDAEPEIAARYGIQSIPTVAVFRDGQVATGFVGAYPAATIGRFFDEQVLADQSEEPKATAAAAAR